MAYNACSPARIYGPVPQTLFCGCSILSFSASVGWNEQSSTVTVELVKDECSGLRIWYDENLNRQSGIIADPGFTFPEPGCAAYFRIEEDPYAPTDTGRGGFEYAGIIQSWTEKHDANGNPVYSVKLSDPRFLLNNTKVIVNDFIGAHSGVWNLLNVYGAVESCGTPCLASPAGGIGGTTAYNTVGTIANDRGIVWNDVKCMVQTLTSSEPRTWATFCRDNRLVYVGPRNGTEGYGILASDGVVTDPGLTGIPNANLNVQHYTLDLTEVPFGPQYYRISGPVLSITDMLNEVCRDAGCDYYVELLPTKDGGNLYKTIKVRVAVRQNQPPTGVLDQFIAARQTKYPESNGGILNYVRGEETRNEETSVYLIGGKERNPYVADETLLMPFWGFDSNGSLIQAQIINGEYYVRIDVTRLNNSLFVPFSSSFIWVSERELMAALADQQSFVMMSFLAGGNLATHFNTLGTFAFGNFNALLDAWAALRPAHDVAIVPVNFASQAIANTNEADLSNIFSFIREYAQEYYGRQFLVLEPNVCFATDLAAGILRYTHLPSTEGCWVPDITTSIIGLAHGSAASDLFRDEVGKYGPILRYAIGGSYSLGQSSGPRNYIATPSEITSADYIAGTVGGAAYMWVRGEIEPFWVHGTPLNPAAPTISFVIKSSEPIVHRTSLEAPGVLVLNTPAFAGIVGGAITKGLPLPVPDIILRSSFTFASANIALKPIEVLCPELSLVTVYGPWGIAGLPGPVKVEIDEGLVPWEYGSDSIMSLAALDKVSSAVAQMRKNERGSVTVAGFPNIPLGAELMAVDSATLPPSQGAQKYALSRTASWAACATGVNCAGGSNTQFIYVPMNAWSGDYGPSITDINVQVGSNGFTTTYQFSTYTPVYGRFNKDNAERLKRIGRAWLNLMRNIRARDKLRAQAIISRSRRLRLNEMLGRSRKAPRSPHELIIGRSFKDPLNRNRNEITTQFSQDATVAFQNNTTYSKTSLMSLDGLLRPVSKQGDGGYARYIQVSGQDCADAKDSTDPPDPPIKEYTRLDVSINYLDPVANPNDTLPTNRSDTPATGHDIEILGRGTSLSGTWSIPFAEEKGGGYGYASDYRMFAFKGPMLIQQWGYDLHGKPVPNKADTDANAKNGIFTSTNLQDKFLDGWLQKPETWPVAPLDLRLDRERGVWTTPQPPRNIHVSINGCLNQSGDFTPLNIKPVYDSAGTQIASPTVTVHWPWDVKPPRDVGRIPVYYDTVDCKYYAFPANRFDVEVSGTTLKDVKLLRLGDSIRVSNTGEDACGAYLTIDASGSGGGGGTQLIVSGYPPPCSSSYDGGPVDLLVFSCGEVTYYPSQKKAVVGKGAISVENIPHVCGGGTSDSRGCVSHINFSGFDVIYDDPDACSIVVQNTLLQVEGFDPCPTFNAVTADEVCKIQFSKAFELTYNATTKTATVDRTLNLFGTDKCCSTANVATPVTDVRQIVFDGFNTSYNSASCTFTVEHNPYFNASGYNKCSSTLVGGDVCSLFFGSGLDFTYDSANCLATVDYELELVAQPSKGCGGASAPDVTLKYPRKIVFEGFDATKDDATCTFTVKRGLIQASGYDGCNTYANVGGEVCLFKFGSGLTSSYDSATKTFTVDYNLVVDGKDNCCSTTNITNQNYITKLIFSGFDTTYDSNTCAVTVAHTPYFKISGYDSECNGSLVGGDACLLTFGSGLKTTYNAGACAINVESKLYVETLGGCLNEAVSLEPATRLIFSGLDGEVNSSTCEITIKNKLLQTDGYANCPPASVGAGDTCTINFGQGLDYSRAGTTATINYNLKVAGGAHLCGDTSSFLTTNNKYLQFRGFQLTVDSANCGTIIDAIPTYVGKLADACDGTTVAGVPACEIDFRSGLQLSYSAGTAIVDAIPLRVTASNGCGGGAPVVNEVVRNLTLNGFDATYNAANCSLTVNGGLSTDGYSRCPIAADAGGATCKIKFGQGLDYTYDAGTSTATVDSNLKIVGQSNACVTSAYTRDYNKQITFKGFNLTADAANCGTIVEAVPLKVDGYTDACNPGAIQNYDPVCKIVFNEGLKTQYNAANGTVTVDAPILRANATAACGGGAAIVNEPVLNLDINGIKATYNTVDCTLTLDGGIQTDGYNGCPPAADAGGPTCVMSFGQGLNYTYDAANDKATIDYDLQVVGDVHCCFDSSAYSKQYNKYLKFRGFKLFDDAGNCGTIVEAVPLQLKGYNSICSPGSLNTYGDTCTLEFGSGLKVTYNSIDCSAVVDAALLQATVQNNCDTSAAAITDVSVQKLIFDTVGASYNSANCELTISGGIAVEGYDGTCAQNPISNKRACAIHFGPNLQFSFDDVTKIATVDYNLIIDGANHPCYPNSWFNQSGFKTIQFNGFDLSYDSATCTVTVSNSGLVQFSGTGPCNGAVVSGLARTINFVSGLDVEYDSSNCELKVGYSNIVDFKQGACPASITEKSFTGINHITFSGFDYQEDAGNACHLIVANPALQVMGRDARNCASSPSYSGGDTCSIRFEDGFRVSYDNSTNEIKVYGGVSGVADKLPDVSDLCCTNNGTFPVEVSDLTKIVFRGFRASGDATNCYLTIDNIPLITEGYSRPCDSSDTQVTGYACKLIFGEGLEYAYNSSKCEGTVSSVSTLVVSSVAASGSGCGGSAGGGGPFSGVRHIKFSGVDISYDSNTCTATISNPGNVMQLVRSDVCGKNQVTGSYNKLTFGSGFVTLPDPADACNLIVHGGIGITYHNAGGCNTGTQPKTVRDLYFGPGALQVDIDSSNCSATISFQPRFTATEEAGADMQVTADCSKNFPTPIVCDVCDPNPTGSGMQDNGPYCLRKPPKYLESIHAGHGLGIASCDDCSLILFNNTRHEGVDSNCAAVKAFQASHHLWSDDFQLSAGPEQGPGCPPDADWTKSTKIELSKGGGTWTCGVITGLSVVKVSGFVVDVFPLTAIWGGDISCGGTYWIRTLTC